jgi:tetratricopeptide (TPR) repeat protein
MEHYNEAEKLVESKELIDVEKALESIKKAIEINPNDFNYWLLNKKILVTLSNKTSDSDKKKNYLNDAITSINKVIELNGEKADYFYDKSKIFASLVDYPSAIIEIKKAIEIAPDNSLYHYYSGDLYFNFKDYQTAISSYTKAIELNGKESDYYYWRGRAKKNTKDIKGALDDFTKSIELNNKNAMAYNSRALLKQRELKDLEGAKQDFDLAISINSSYKENRSNLEFQMKSSFKPIVLFLVLSFIGLLIFRPIISIGNGAFLLIFAVVSILVNPFIISKKNVYSDDPNLKNKKLVSWSLTVLFVSLWLFNWVLRFDIWSADTYKDVLGEVSSNSSFQKDIHEAEKEHMIIFDEIVARNIGEKVLGSETTLGSQATLGTFALQNVNGKFYWVAPLIHSGFFKYLSNKDAGTPGYVKVSANNDQDVELVTKVDGKQLKIVYQSGSSFFKNIYNHLFLRGYFTYKIDEPEFEIDDKGNPFWVIPISKKHFGSKVLNVDRLLIVNPENGEITEHDPHNVPKWVDRVYTPEILEDQVDWWGEYVHGYWNFAHKDIMVPSGKMVMVYGKEGHCMWYQGMTSKGLDNATVGFLLIDSKSKKINFYKRVGATEVSAMQSAEGKVQEKGYYAGHPTAYNISGEPTYLVPLHDKSDLVKAIALVNIHDYNHLVVGANLDESLRDYEILMSGESNARNKGKDNKLSLKAKVLRVNSLLRGGLSTYAILLNTSPKISLFGDPLQLNELMFVYPNDSVSVEYYPITGQHFGNIVKFENLSIK